MLYPAVQWMVFADIGLDSGEFRRMVAVPQTVPGDWGGAGGGTALGLSNGGNAGAGGGRVD